NHNRRVFVEGEADMVCSAGYNADRLARGWSLDELVDIRLVVTNLCTLDFGGPEHQMRLRSLHPGVSAEDVQAATGFPVVIPDDVVPTPDPTADELELLVRLDPHNLRAGVLGG